MLFRRCAGVCFAARIRIVLLFAIAAVGALAQIEREAAVAELQAGGLQLLLKIARIPRQFSQRLRIVSGDHSRNAVVARDFHAHFNPAEIGRIETQFKVGAAAIEAANNLAANLRRCRRRALSASVGRHVLNVGACL